MFVATLLVPHATADSGVEEPPGCILNMVEGPPLTARWSFSEEGPEIGIQGDDTIDTTVVIQARAWFGGLEYTWNSQPIEVDAESCTTVPFTVPSAAFLHALADEYVTDVLVRVQPYDVEDNALQETVLAPVYAIWPDGQGTSVVVWDKDLLAQNAPHGVLDPNGFHAPTGELAQFNVRILPPIGQEINLARSEPTDERTNPRTVPVDDNSDEEVE